MTETHHQLDVSKEMVNKPFEYEEKLSEYLTRQSEINTKLEFTELSKQQDTILSESNAEDEANENDMEEENENDGFSV